MVAVRLQVIHGESLTLINTGTGWILPSLNASMKYAPPNTQDGTANLCTWYAVQLSLSFSRLADPNKSSWASYNLVSACTACQGFPEQIPQ